MVEFDLLKSFEYENGFYLTSNVNRISKFVTHLDLFRKTSGLPGEIVECGVFKGCSLSRFIKFRSLIENCYSRRIIAFDTFGFFPEANFEDDKLIREKFITEAGESSISLETFSEILNKLGLSKNVELVAGNIISTLPDYLDKHPQLRISLLHIDVDLYEATKLSLELLYPRVVTGGVIILDDYGAFPGANKAIEEFFMENRVKIQKLSYSNAISFVVKD